METYLKASNEAILDLHSLALQNNNPLISHYRQGYEGYFNSMPVITPYAIPEQIAEVNDALAALTARLAGESWVRTHSPISRDFLRTVLAIQKPLCTGAALKDGPELIVVNWRQGVTTPTHGHVRGYMHERLIYGKLLQTTYRVTDAVKKIVRPISIDLYCNTNDIIDAGYNDDKEIENGAFVHDFKFLEQSATINLVPGHPKDTVGNLFTVEQFLFKDLLYKLEQIVPVSLDATLHMPPGEVILVRSETTKDLGDHFYVITGDPKQKRAGLRPVGKAIPASEDYSKLLDTFAPQSGEVTVLRLQAEVRDMFLKWHGIRVVKHILFPQP